MDDTIMVEYIDLVDESDQVIKSIVRGGERDGLFVRYVKGFVLREDTGEVLVPRRDMERDHKPGAYDYSAAGAVSAGESYPLSMIREFEEEIGLLVDEKNLSEIAYMTPDDTGRSFYRLYLVSVANGDGLIAGDGYDQLEWYTIDDAISLISGLDISLYKGRYDKDLLVLKDYLSTMV